MPISFFPYNYLEDQIMDKFIKDISVQLNNLDLKELNKTVQQEVEKTNKNFR